MKLGMEVELWVVDDRGRLSDGRAITDAHERIQPEFVAPLVEVRTEPHEAESALRSDLQETLEAAIEAATAAGKRLVPLGTPLSTASPPATDERGRLFEAIYGDGVVSAKNCAGTHVHFEQREVARQLNVLTALDPALALVSSSPYYRGTRSMDSARAYAYRTDCGEDFRRFCGLWPYVGNVDEWESRVEAVAGTFEALAIERGVDPARVAAHFCPEDTVLNPVRLRRAVPTVEWRAPDAALPTELVRLAFDVRDVVERTTDRPLSIEAADVEAEDAPDGAVPVPAFPELRRLSQEAIHSGLRSERVRDYLRRLGLDPAAYDPISPRLVGPGTISETDAREFRLRYAERLCEDVPKLTGTDTRRTERPTTGSYLHV